jgi:hypothetical protein
MTSKHNSTLHNDDNTILTTVLLKITFAIYGLHQHNSNDFNTFCRISQQYRSFGRVPTQQQRRLDVLQDFQLQFMACTNTTATFPKRPEGFTISLFWARPNSTATSPRRPAGFTNNIN